MCSRFSANSSSHYPIDCERATQILVQFLALARTALNTLETAHVSREGCSSRRFLLSENPLAACGVSSAFPDRLPRRRPSSSCFKRVSKDRGQHSGKSFVRACVWQNTRHEIDHFRRFEASGSTASAYVVLQRSLLSISRTFSSPPN